MFYSIFYNINIMMVNRKDRMDKNLWHINIYYMWKKLWVCGKKFSFDIDTGTTNVCCLKTFKFKKCLHKKKNNNLKKDHTRGYDRNLFDVIIII